MFRNNTDPNKGQRLDVKAIAETSSAVLSTVVMAAFSGIAIKWLFSKN